jgi:hypothetical protein
VQCIYVCVYIHFFECVYIVYEFPLLPNNIVNETFLHKMGSSAKCRLDVYQWGAGLAVTGRVRDIRRNVLQYSFKKEAVAAPFTSTFSVLSHSSTKPVLVI